MTLPEFPTLWAVLTVIACILVNDIAWALYIRRTGDGLAAKAAFWASVIYASGIVTTISVLHNYWLIAVAVVTTFCGTYVTITLDAQKKKDNVIR